MPKLDMNTNYNNIKKDLNEYFKSVLMASKKVVYVGWPDAQLSSNSGHSITLGKLALYHDQGLGHNPSRKLIDPVIKNNKQSITSLLKKSYKKLLKNPNDDSGLKVTGEIVTGMIKAHFYKNDWTPLKPATIAYRNRVEARISEGKTPDGKNTGRGNKTKSKPIPYTSANSLPLLWTGTFMRSATYYIGKL